ncbi:TetR/AcrR family transcriptional regulator [Jiangella anatolica]|uniref:TetR family transcriptional regulator n=1 Tax=Jiangella anatolica TaxID=2670374 RepID=A0A2W2AZL5_9ACTN|nr:TetR family transcriptional regulator [Jiangella anatolica]PZF80635.1 TetR family transcriptional regulator [Jiangella anatolica]
MGKAATRRYDATGRQAQAQVTRARILDAAQRLFLEQGYSATSVAQIAAAAGVSAPTVFAAYKSKVNLLKEAVDVAIVGDADAVPLAQRPVMRRVHEAATAAEMMGRYAEAVTEVGNRAVPIFMVAYRAADADPEIAGLVADLDRQRLAGAGMIADAVAARLGGLGTEDHAALRDTIWTMNSPQLYDLLVGQRGWPVSRYRDWIETTLLAHLAGYPQP